MRPVALAALALVLWASACAPAAPAHWAVGGAPLQVPVARWRGSMLKQDVSLNAQGVVSVAGEVRYYIEPEGRVRDAYGEPFAVLDGDGYLVGTDDRYLGRVGRHNAAPPWSGVAWLRVARDGNVFLLSAGQVVATGSWSGCGEAGLSACTLVTHLIALESIRPPAPPMQPRMMPPPMWYRPYYWGYWGWY